MNATSVPTMPKRLVAPPRWTDLPSAISARGFRYVQFSGCPKALVKLQRTERPRSELAATGQALEALEGWLSAQAAGVFSGTFDAYNRNANLGWPTIPVARYRRDESRTVCKTRRFARQRVFPVPALVHADRRLAMWQHIALGSDSHAPRMYFTVHDGIAYVGGIGPHPTNTKTASM